MEKTSISSGTNSSVEDGADAASPDYANNFVFATAPLETNSLD